VTDRWTEAQLRGDLYWVLSITWAGGTFHLSTDGLYIVDGAGSVTTTPDLIDAPQVEEALEIWSVESPRLSVPLSFILPLDVPGLIAQGHALDGAVAELSQWAAGTEWDERRVIVRGKLVDPEYGAEWEPVTCSLEEMVADDQTTLPIEVITIAPWLARAVSTLSSADVGDAGVVIPMVWGTPGATTAAGSPAPIIGTSGSLVYLGIACHYVEAFSVDIIDSAGTMETFVVYYTDLRQYWGFTRGIPLVAWVVVDTSTSSLVLTDGLFVIWNNGAALVDESAQAIRGAGDLIAHVLRRSALRVDWSRVDAARVGLNQYATSGYINEPVALGEYMTEVLSAVFPFAMSAGPGGVYPYLWPVYPDATQALAVLSTDVDPSLERVGRIAYEGSDEVATYIDLRYGWNPQTEGYALSQRVTGSAYVPDPFLVAIKQLIGPLSRYGLRRKVVETTVVHDAITATKVLVAQAARYGQPSRMVQYVAPQRYGWLRRGDLVTLTDVEIAAQDQMMMVEGVTWGEDGTITFTLRYIEAGA
jgi:hypothetical protein